MTRWFKVLGTAALLFAVPIGVSNMILSDHALKGGLAETRDIAESYVERAEDVINEGLSILKDVRNANHTDCTVASRTAFGQYAFKSQYVQQIGIVENDGTLLCGEPMGALFEPVRLPVTEPGDPSVMLGILTDGKDDRQAVVTLRVSDHRRLVARFHRNSLALNAGPTYLQDKIAVHVYLEDGSTWYEPATRWKPETEPDAQNWTMTSHRYPLKVSVTSSAAATLATIAPLKTIVMVVASIFALGVFSVSLWTIWQRDGGDSFTRAVRNNEFIPYYQPVFDVFTREVRGCEVLVRWQRPNGKMVPPGQFLPYAEATGLIREITRQLMEQTVEDVADIYSIHKGLKLSINLTAMHFNDMTIIDEIRDTFSGTGIDYDSLCFEVTEQNPLKDINLSRQIIQEIQALGCSVALDDVGTGHGGLAYLQQLGVDIIKIDKMFIDHIGTDHSSQTIVDTLVELGNQLKLGIIAEGVETEDQVEYLKGLGVSTAQGYVFAKPLPAKAYREILLKSLEESKKLGAAAPDAPDTVEAKPDQVTRDAA